MEINIKEFQSLSDEKCRYELRITELERQVGCLQAENQMLKKHVEFLETTTAVTQMANMFLRNYLMLSVEKIRVFVRHLNGIEKFSFIKAFLEYGLPQEHRREQQDLVDQLMVLPDETKPVGDTHYYFASGSNNQVFNGETSGQFGTM